MKWIILNKNINFFVKIKYSNPLYIPSEDFRLRLPNSADMHRLNIGMYVSINVHYVDLLKGMLNQIEMLFYFDMMRTGLLSEAYLTTPCHSHHTHNVN